MTTATALLTDSGLRPASTGSERSSRSAALTTGEVIRFKFSEGGTLLWQTLPALPPWVTDVANKLEELLDLPFGWDTYQGEPIGQENVESGFQALISIIDVGTPRPHVVPTVRGGVQFEWHTPAADLEFEVLAPFRFQVLFENHRSGEIEEREVTSDFGTLRDWVRILA